MSAERANESHVREASTRWRLLSPSCPAPKPATANSEMAELVAAAIESRRHLIVQAGTGTGKTLAYLVPAVLSGKRVVVSTATKALQDQLAGKDLPFLAAAAPAVRMGRAQGRSNYLCLQRLREVNAGEPQGQLEIEELAPATRVDVERIARWATTTDTGDLAELDFAPSEAAVRSVTVGSDECPGADRCPMGEPCFTEQARGRAPAPPTCSWSTPTSTACTSAATAASCPSTTSSCSTRPTVSRTS